MAITVFAATTAASSGTLRVEKNDTPAALHQKGLAGVETIDIMRSTDGGTTFEDYKVGGNVQKLSVDDNSVSIKSPGIYKADKGVTVGAAGVTASLGRNV